MRKKILLLGSTGKMGTAIMDVLSSEYEIEGKNSRDFDAADFEKTRQLIEACQPDIVINTVAFLGIDPCEKEPAKAFRLNTLYPKVLAELSKEKGFLLIHFSTNAIFNDEKKDLYTEDDKPCPLNMYGLTKYGGDCIVQGFAKDYYIIRVPVLFGETSKNTQFVEKMLERVNQGQATLRISADIISSPTHSKDVARKIKEIMESNMPSGVYHVCNEGMPSLYDLMEEIISHLGLKVVVEKASHKEFPHVGIENVFTPMASKKLKALRPWKEAVREYCQNIKRKGIQRL